MSGPTCLRAFFASFTREFPGLYWSDLFSPCTQMIVMRLSLMLALSFEQLQILWAIIRAVMIDVVDAFVWIQQSTKHGFHDQSVLIHVAVSVGVRMVRRRAVDVAARVQPSSAFPFVTPRAVRNLMTLHIHGRLPLVVAAFGMITRGYWRRLTTSTGADSVLVDGLLQTSSSDEAIAGCWATGPVPLAKSLRGSDYLPATTLTRAVFRCVSHMPIISIRPRLA